MASEREAIEAFWVWWETARHRLLRAIEIDRRFPPELVDDVQAHVTAIGGDLDWELGAGTTSRHAFFLSGKGDPALRRITERWRRMAPRPDAEWAYFPARQARPTTLELVFAEVPLAASALTVALEVDTTHRRVHGQYFHPAFAQLEESARTTALFVLLDGLLGEDGVERWLGAIELAAGPPEGAQPISALLSAIGELSELPAGEGFIVLKGQLPSGEPLFVTIDAAIKRIDHLLATQHLSVELPIEDGDANGMPTRAAAERLDALESALNEQIGDAVYFGRETSPGRRQLHWFVTEGAPAIAAARQWAAANGATVRLLDDPHWEAARRFGAG